MRFQLTRKGIKNKLLQFASMKGFCKKVLRYAISFFLRMRNRPRGTASQTAWGGLSRLGRLLSCIKTDVLWRAWTSSVRSQPDVLTGTGDFKPKRSSPWGQFRVGAKVRIIWSQSGPTETRKYWYEAVLVCLGSQVQTWGWASWLMSMPKMGQKRDKGPGLSAGRRSRCTARWARSGASTRLRLTTVAALSLFLVLGVFRDRPGGLKRLWRV